MNNLQFLNYLQSLNVRLWLEEDRLRYRAPPDCPIEEVKAELVKRKRELVSWLRQRRAGGMLAITKTERTDPIPLTFAQRRLWFLDQLQPGVPTYNVYDSIEITHEVDVPALRRAVDELVRRHELLRTSFPATEGVPYQLIATASSVPLPLIDISHLPEAERIAEARRMALREARTPFDLARGPLLRVRLIKLDRAHYVWLLCIHHIVSDDWSKNLINQELEQLYAAYLSGKPSPLPELPIQWADFALWQQRWLRGEILEAHVDYWARCLEGELPSLNLPLDHPRRDPAHGRKGKFFFRPSLAIALKALAVNESASLFMVLLAGYAALLSRYTGQGDLIVGSPISDRNLVETEQLIGFLLNTLPLRIRVDGQSSFRELLRQVKEICLGAYSYQAVPYESLMHRLQVGRDGSGSPLFRTMLTMLSTPPTGTGGPGALWSSGTHADGDEIDNLAGESGRYMSDVGTNTSMFDLSITMIDHPKGIWGKTEYNSDIFDESSIAALIERLQVLLGAAAAAPDERVCDLPLMTPTQEREMLVSRSRGPALALTLCCVHQFVEEQARSRPHALAIDHESAEQRVSYHELNCRANRLAHFLRRAGVGLETRVGILFERSTDLFVAIIGVLKAGGAYVPLDVNYPSERIEFILADACVEMVIAREGMSGLLGAYKRQVFGLGDHEDEIMRECVHDPAPVAQGENMACVLYTSGSSGRPKGVALTHGAQVSYIEDAASAYGIDADDRILQFHSIAFDASLEESYLAFARGAVLVLRPECMIDSIDVFLHYCDSLRLTTLSLPTVYWHALVGNLDERVLPEKLRRVIIGGERALPAMIAKWQECVGARIELYNTYGPTEGTIVASRYHVPEPTSESASSMEVPIGTPVANARVYVLDPQMRPLPPGMPGEICIGGLGVARGYVGCAGLTAEKFVPDPFDERPGVRLYRTGDLGRFLPDGNLQYRGRLDEQVKIRGFRIELAEIEAQLVRHPGVEEAVVVARQEGEGEKRLVGYVIPKYPDHSPSVEGLREHLTRALPEYMVPSAFLALKAFPISPNGKLDRRALPAPELSAYASRAYETPQGEVEETLAGIWQELLHVERVGRNDNFFELGGHSLLIVQLMERLRRVGLTSDLRRVFESPTLWELARGLSRGVSEVEMPPNRIPPGCSHITSDMLTLVELTPEHLERIEQAVPGGPANIHDIYPLVPLQEGMLFHHLLDETGGDTYILSMLLSVSSRGRLDELIAAFQKVIDRHDVLRTAVLWEWLPRAVQVVHRRVTLPVEEVTLDSEREIDEQLREWLEPERQWMDLRQAPLMRLKVAADPHSDRWYVLRQLHHIACDHVTAEAITQEVAACLDGRAQQLPAVVPYRNHVAQSLAYARTHDAQAFFRAKLGDIDEPSAPFGLMEVRGTEIGVAEALEDVDASLAARVRVQARRLGVSAATVFHAAWALVVSKCSNRDDVVCGTVLLGRLQGSAGAQRILGVFMNTLPLRIRLQGLTAQGLVESTQRELVELLDHEQASLAEAQRCSAIGGAAPLFTTLLNYRHSVPNAEAQWDGVQGIEVLGGYERTNYPITVSVDDLGGGFRLSVQTDRRIEPKRILSYLQITMASLVGALENRPGIPALSLEVLPDAERRKTLELFNATKVAYPQDTPIHKLFEEQVARTPGAVAVKCEEESLTYAELNARANQLAWYLRAKGVRQDHLVGICVERGVEMVVGVLGILKAGGAYVPLDPTYPSERLSFMIEDVAPKIVVTQEWLIQRLPQGVSQVIGLDSEWARISLEETDNPPAETTCLRSDHLAYVIYTSGSTGKPKGVMIEHRNIVRLFAAAEDCFDFNAQDVWTLFHSFAFDFSVWELWGALLNGGRLVIVPNKTARSPNELYRLLCQEGVTVLNQTPSAFAQLIEAQEESPELSHALRVVIFGGEALEFRTLRPWVKRNGSKWPELVNMYGITETTVHVTYRKLSEEEILSERGSIIGKPIPDMPVYLLDRQGQPVPIGVAGEIYVGGAGVARGYLNRAEQTAERFLPDPFSADPGARMYKSGDLGRWRSDESMEYLGRNDEQVKIRGFRIELGEIEAQLVRHGEIKEAVVVARQEGEGEKRLVGYVIAKDPDHAPFVDGLREHLKAVLPEYMVPNAFVALEAFPLSANGKLDRRALPAPELTAYASSEYEAPRGEVEEILAGIWQEVLHVERIGRNDNFFELGGHSLIAMKVIAAIRDRLGAVVPVADIFEYPTIQQMAVPVTQIHAQNGGNMSDELEELDEGSIGP